VKIQLVKIVRLSILVFLPCPLAFKIDDNDQMFAKGGIDGTSLSLSTKFIESTKA
jgi:hypothetical protein